MMKCMKSNKKKAFTLAEILLSLTVIGIVAAIALPSLLGNANERAWATQKKALHTRMAQAIPLLPSLNGYGVLSTTTNGNTTTVTDTAAETFVRDGLSKVIKMTNICDNSSLADCGLPSKIIALDGSTPITLASISTLGGLNDGFTSGTWGAGASVPLGYQQQDSKAVAFETANGESVLVYYYPNCKSEMAENEGYFGQTKMCANFIYDLNGIKGPNTVGKDIGFITALYATNSSVVAPDPYPTLTAAKKQTEAAAACKELYSDSKLPNVDEAISLYTNRQLISQLQSIWTSTSKDADNAWYVYLLSGGVIPKAKNETNVAMCLKR